MTDLPPELAALERRLKSRPRPDPPDHLGPRVLAACRDADEPTAWRWAVAAALILLAANLSQSLATATAWDLRPAVEPPTVARLQTIAPDLPEAEYRRQALLWRAAADLPPSAAPVWKTPRPVPETNRWATP